VLIGIDKSGRWLLQEEALLLGAARDPRLARLNDAMPEIALDVHPGPAGEVALTTHGGARSPIDVVFPVLHGPTGEDGCVQGLLELAGVPYVGSGVLGSAVGMDKDVMKRLLREAEIPIVPHVTLRKAAWDRDRGACLAQVAALGAPRSERGERSERCGPVFVKPANLGSSVGVRRVTARADLEAAVEHAFEFDLKVVCEQGIEGVREIECAVLGDDDPIASVPGEIVVGHADGFYSYAAKYIDADGAAIRIPADLSPAEDNAVRLLALRAFRALEAAGMARVDMFLSPAGELYVNEINTIPGFTAISMYPKLWEASGVPARELVERLVALALERGARKGRLRTSA
jgi:D-alanine-D-alanine ligase